MSEASAPVARLFGDDLVEPSPDERVRAFMATLVRPGVDVAMPATAANSLEMEKRPDGIVAFGKALRTHQLDSGALSAYRNPVYFSYGSLSNPRWETMGARFQSVFEDCVVERCDGNHHLMTSHLVDPQRVANALRRLWSRAPAAADEVPHSQEQAELRGTSL